MTTELIPVQRAGNPFPAGGITRDEHDVAHFDELPESLPAMLRGWVDATPDAEAVAELGGDRLSYRQLWDRAARVAGGLRERGVRAGDRVAVRYPAGLGWVLGFWGSLLAGAVPVAVNTRSAEPEIEYVLADSGAVVDLADTPLPDGDPVVAPAAAGGDLATLFYTSGTTGRPKGVPSTHEACLSACESLARAIGAPRDGGDAFRTLIAIPLFHVTGCNAQLLLAGYLGGAAVIMPVMKPHLLAAAVPAERITFFLTVPAVYALLLRRALLDDVDVSGVRWAAYGGSPIASSLVAEIKSAFPGAQVLNGFGMTETCGALTVLPDRDAAAHADSVGYALPGVDLAVEAPDESGVGELLVRGANVTRGYWNRDDANEDTFVGGWMRTGDIVRVDEAGRVHIVDRAKDIIIRGGENVSSVEVEDALASAPGVAEAAVIGVPDEVMGEKVGAVLVAGDELDVAAVLEHCGRRIADFKIPQYVAVQTEPLPRNPSGKVVKAVLRQRTTWGAPVR